MKVHNMYNLEEENAARIHDIRQEIKHISISLEGVLKKVLALEKFAKDQAKDQADINTAFKEALEVIAEELDLGQEGAES